MKMQALLSTQTSLWRRIQEQSDLATGFIVALQALSANLGDTIKELKKEQKKAYLQVMFVEMGLDPINFEEQIANVVEQKNWNFNAFGMF